MSFYDDVDDNYEGVGERIEHGGLIPPGFYRVQLVGAKEIESKTKGTPGIEWTFQFREGVFAGQEHTDTLYKFDGPRFGDLIKNAKLMLGLCKLEGTKLVPVENKTDFLDCIGAQTVIEIRHEPGFKDPEKKVAKFAMNGFHDERHSKVKEHIARTLKGGGAKPAAAGKPSEPEKPAEKPAATQTPAAKKRDVSKL